MAWYTRASLFLLTCSVAVPTTMAKEPPAKAKIELRWVESKQIEGVTEDKGFQSSCDEKDVVYPHKKAALTLTATEVSKVSITELDLTKNGLSMQYNVVIDLTKDARAKLAATVEGKEMRLLTVVVDGKCWGVRRYEKDSEKKNVPTQARAETFRPDIGFFSSKADAERIVDALK